MEFGRKSTCISFFTNLILYIHICIPRYIRAHTHIYSNKRKTKHAIVRVFLHQHLLACDVSYEKMFILQSKKKKGGGKENNNGANFGQLASQQKFTCRREAHLSASTHVKCCQKHRRTEYGRSLRLASLT